MVLKIIFCFVLITCMTHLQVLAAVLENTQDGENEIEGESQGESPGDRRLKESKVVRMKLPAQVGD